MALMGFNMAINTALFITLRAIIPKLIAAFTVSLLVYHAMSHAICTYIYVMVITCDILVERKKIKV